MTDSTTDSTSDSMNDPINDPMNEAPASAPRYTPSPSRKPIGLGFLPAEARHGFLIDVPKGSGNGDLISITEHRGNDLNQLGERSTAAPNPNDPSLRVVIDRGQIGRAHV